MGVLETILRIYRFRVCVDVGIDVDVNLSNDSGILWVVSDYRRVFRYGCWHE